MSSGAERRLAGKVALVTGATSGIGLETASALAGMGATVILGARNQAKAEDVAKLIRDRHQGNVQVEIGPNLDLKSLDGVRNFVEEFEKQGRPLHILVNNAGANQLRASNTKEGVADLVQVNYLSAFALTRLLEKKLVESSPSRVVNVSSVTARIADMPEPKEFLYNWRKGRYQSTKLSNVLFSKELHRRLQPHGVDSCCVDPGGVNSSIWDRGGPLSRFPIRNIIGAFYAPPSDGATAVIHAASQPWTSQGPNDHHFFARGLFSSPLVTRLRPKGDGGIARRVEFTFFGVGTLLCSFLDWPMRWMSGKLLCSSTKKVRQPYGADSDETSAELWDLSCRLVGVPSSPVVAAPGAAASSSRA